MGHLAIRKNPPSIFGKAHLGYMVIETQKFKEWARFGRDVIGLHVDEIDADTMKFRLDDHECRFLVRRGPAEDIVALGWEIDDHESFDEILTRVTERAVPVEEGTAEEAALRGVERLWRIPGPKGIAQEIFTTPITTDAPLRMVNAGGYVTGESGMGHVAIFTREPGSLRAYYNTVFDARLSDYIETGPMLARFLRVNQRHHSIAVIGGKNFKIDPFRTKVEHLNIEASSLEDMVAAFERVVDGGIHIQMPIGQHSNDRELSFYCRTPSGFSWEIGWNPLLITREREDTWEPNNYSGISLWGHTPMGTTIVDALQMFKNVAARSVGYREPTVPEFDAGITPEGKEREFASTD